MVDKHIHYVADETGSERSGTQLTQGLPTSRAQRKNLSGYRNTPAPQLALGVAETYCGVFSKALSKALVFLNWYLASSEAKGRTW